MSKTIEELASEYYSNEVINGDTCDDKDGWTDCFVSGADALMQLPLASRLTTEEKERVREEYSDNKCLIESASLSYVQREVFQKINETLESIFGKDFFKEGE